MNLPVPVFSLSRGRPLVRCRCALVRVFACLLSVLCSCASRFAFAVARQVRDLAEHPAEPLGHVDVLEEVPQGVVRDEELAEGATRAAEGVEMNRPV